jgi:RimJ/RimL family protein N-acetyltransferase
MKLVPFEVGHLDSILPNELENLETVLGIPEKEFMRLTAERSLCMTALTNDDKVFMIAGVHPLWKGVFEVWIHITPDFYKNKISAVKAIRQLLAQMKQTVGYNRIQADVRADLTKNIDFVKLFGFTFEGSMIKYGFNGETYLRFALYGE